jgi:PIN domain nuclease of toxin-antitoxin system
MKYLLDTHAFIWLDNDPDKLSTRSAELCRDPNNILLLSVVSIWEMQIKLQLGKLTLPAPLRQTIENQQRDNQITLLPIELPHIYGLSNLPDHHKDPFDRLLIAQAMIEGLTLLTNDPYLVQYPVKSIW